MAPRAPDLEDGDGDETATGRGARADDGGLRGGTMVKPDWGELSRKLGAQLPPLRPGDLAPAPAPWPECDRCGKRRTVGRVTREGILCAACVGVLRDLGQLDDGEDGA